MRNSNSSSIITLFSLVSSLFAALPYDNEVPKRDMNNVEWKVGFGRGYHAAVAGGEDGSRPESHTSRVAQRARQAARKARREAMMGKSRPLISFGTRAFKDNGLERTGDRERVKRTLMKAAPVRDGGKRHTQVPTGTQPCPSRRRHINEAPTEPARIGSRQILEHSHDVSLLPRVVRETFSHRQSPDYRRLEHRFNSSREERFNLY